jgi:hypothetical protein
MTAHYDPVSHYGEGIPRHNPRVLVLGSEQSGPVLARVVEENGYQAITRNMATSFDGKERRHLADIFAAILGAGRVVVDLRATPKPEVWFYFFGGFALALHRTIIALVDDETPPLFREKFATVRRRSELQEAFREWAKHDGSFVHSKGLPSGPVSEEAGQSGAGEAHGRRARAGCRAEAAGSAGKERRVHSDG